MRCGWTLAAGLMAAALAPAPADEADLEFFEREVRPILAGRCAECHGPEKARGGLRLDSLAAVLAGGDSGPAAVAGNPDESPIVEAVRYLGEPKMPPDGKLPDRAIAALERWVERGMPWPGSVGREGPSRPAAPDSEKGRDHWAFRPVGDFEPPAVRDEGWPRSDLDRFILARLESEGLRPAPEADRRAWLRRVTFDLVGLPPTPEEVEAFLADEAPDAYEKVVDRLLASPHHGERWGRHWLDVVRYADSFDARIVGNEMDINDAWRYRDWVVDAFNRDLPYDAFVQDQVAGDLRPGPEPGDLNVAGTIATGMLAIGNWGGGDADKEKLLTDIADDQVDVVSRAFLGLTVACARCHDHKFDPIPTRDYYGLAGIFFSTHILPNVGHKTNGPPMLRIPLETKAGAAAREAHAARLAGLEVRLKSETDAHAEALAHAMAPEAGRYLIALADFSRRPVDESSESLEAYAGRLGLHAFALRRWSEALGFGDFSALATPLRDVHGAPGVHARKGAGDTPSVTANTRVEAVPLLTFRLPPRSISAHPGPSSAVVVAWRSPIAGAVRISGRLADADPAGGDGVAWSLSFRSAAGRRELASGGVENAGAQALAEGQGGEALASVEVRPGDRLELAIRPKGSHTCDTTAVDLVVSAWSGPQVWDLTRDAVDALADANPLPDRHGNPGVWHFEEAAATAGPASLGPELDAALDAYRRALAGGSDRPTLERLAADAQARLEPGDPRSPFRIRSAADESALPPEARAGLAATRAELEAHRAAAPPPPAFANGAQEGGVPGSPHEGTHDVKVHVRGRYDRLGDLVPRHFPTILAGPEEQQESIPSGSGRLELARWLTRPDHPLTARVMVNRAWQHHFGAGIVRTPSNFGNLGEPPTHPELLDWLARRFVAGGWSLRALHREIVLSAAYRQSSVPEPATFRADPDNRLLGRMNRRRLEAEAVRDSLLAVAGTLDRTHGGPSVRDPDAKRRALYVMTIRSDRSGFGPLFDAADPTAMVDARTASTVAPQALFLLNSPFALDAASAFARRVLGEAPDDPARVDRAYRLALGRPAEPDEVSIGLGLLADARAAGDDEQAAWEAYAQVILCANEFLYVD